MGKRTAITWGLMILTGLAIFGQHSSQDHEAAPVDTIQLEDVTIGVLPFREGSLEATGGYNRTVSWRPDVFSFDNETGLWCGNLPPCQTSSVKVEITDAVGSTPFEEMLRVALNCPVPTLNEWGLIAFMVIMAATGGWFILRRKRRA